MAKKNRVARSVVEKRHSPAAQAETETPAGDGAAVNSGDRPPRRGLRRRARQADGADGLTRYEYDGKIVEVTSTLKVKRKKGDPVEPLPPRASNKQARRAKEVVEEVAEATEG